MTDNGGGFNGHIDTSSECEYLSASEMGPYMSADAAAIYAGPRLYNATKNSNVEYMAPIYSVELLGGKVFFLGQICKGEHDNVVLETLKNATFDSILSTVSASTPISIGEIRLEGFVHSHPYCDGHLYSIYSGFFGDEGAAILTGSCYLIEPEKHILYRITKDDVINSYLSCNSIQNNMSDYAIWQYMGLTPYDSRFHCGG